MSPRRSSLRGGPAPPSRLPVHLREHPHPVKLDAAGRAAVLPAAGDHRHAGGPADLHGAPDQRARGDEGHREFVKDFERVAGKENMLAQDRRGVTGGPDDAVREVIYPAVPGGEETLRDLVPSTGPRDRATVSTSSGCSRRPTPTTTAGPDPAARRARVPLQQHRAPPGDRGARADQAHAPATGTGPVLPRGEDVPIDGVVPADLGELLTAPTRAARADPAQRL